MTADAKTPALDVALHPSFRAAPPPYDQQALTTQWERWQETARSLTDSDPALSEFMLHLAEPEAPAHALVASIFGNSPFLSLCAHREPAFLWQILSEGPENAWETLGAYTLSLQSETEQAKLARELRIGKRRLSLLTALADIGQAWPLEQVTQALSDYAALSLDVATGFLLRQGARDGHLLLAHPDDPCRNSGFVVLGMGKLGAGELNYSSDIDIICLYDPSIVRYIGRKTAGEFFIRLTKSLVQIMDERTGDGYVFRTDLRLRPDPSSTAVCLSTDAAEVYYESMGQNWERAAMIKARALAGDRKRGKEFLAHLRPFVWRKSLDFYAIQDIQSIKRQINAHKGCGEVAVAGHNVKLGRGGIREIEFFAQTQQLIWGGRQPGMRTRRTLEALRALVDHGHLQAAVADDLSECYVFLRELEHRLQMIDDAQTQTLPTSADKLAQVATFFGLPDPEQFDQAVRGILRRVEGHYAALFEQSPALSSAAGAAPAGNLVFTGTTDDPETLNSLTQMGFGNAATVSQSIREWHRGRYRALRSTRARELLTELMPRLLQALAQTTQPEQAFLHFDAFLSRLPAGVQIFSLMTNNPLLLDLLTEILGDAPLLAELLSRRPSVLDAVMTPDFFQPVPERAVLQSELARLISPATSYEEILDLCRLWANGRKFQVGVQSLRLLIDARQAGEALTAIADTVLAQILASTQDEFARTHGQFAGGEMVVVALGKMGGREMTATSDLDLMTIYRVADGGAEMSDGKRSLSRNEYYIRLTQRLVNGLTALTREGALYEVDLRLRPSGSKGPLATSYPAFVQYNEQDAWTWEHLALTRARVVCGDPALGEAVEQAVTAILSRPRDLEGLYRDVAKMRGLMARERKPAHTLDVKLTRGGLVDIEFLVQTLTLVHAKDVPALLTPNVGESLAALRAAELLSAADVDQLDEAHKLWLTVQGLLRLCMPASCDPATLPLGVQSLLCRAAGEPDFERLLVRMNEAAQVCFALFEHWVVAPAGPLGDEQGARS